MAFDILTTLQAVTDHLRKNGYFGSAVEIGEPKQPPSALLAASVFMMDASVVEVLVDGTTTERHTVQIRIYVNMLSEPKENLELALAKVTSQVMADLRGEFDLSGTIRNVDVGGQHGPPLGARWGYLDVGGTMYRVVDINLGLVVDETVASAP